MNVLLSPHADDETLFAAYTLLRHRPLVILCHRGKARYGAHAVRVRELARAMVLLGCWWVDFTTEPDLAAALALLPVDRAWAPLPEPGGHQAHNGVGELAAALWPGRTEFFTTYTEGGRTTLGEQVSYERWWPAIKREALACYRSQQRHPSTRPHFHQPLDEYVVSGEAARAVQAQPATRPLPQSPH